MSGVTPPLISIGKRLPLNRVSYFAERQASLAYWVPPHGEEGSLLGGSYAATETFLHLAEINVPPMSSYVHGKPPIEEYWLGLSSCLSGAELSERAMVVEITILDRQKELLLELVSKCRVLDLGLWLDGKYTPLENLDTGSDWMTGREVYFRVEGLRESRE